MLEIGEPSDPPRSSALTRTFVEMQMARTYTRRTLAERFFEKTCPEPNSGCLLWTAAADEHGYGTISVGGREGHDKRAPHVAFFLKHGRWPEPQTNHACDTPACVEASHIYEGTQPQNVKDMVARGRHGQSAKTHCPNGHPYVDGNLYIGANGGRNCRTCGRAARRAYKARTGR
jgi:hypothetical protein